MKRKILFVCLGNICRSPSAEEIFRQLTIKRGVSEMFEIDSAGTYGGHAGSLPDSRMRSAGKKRGYNFDHLSRKVKSDDFEDFDFIVAMDDDNYERLNSLAPSVDATKKVHKMINFVKNTDYTHIPDPYYEGTEGFELVMDMLENGCNNLLDSLLSSK